MKLFSTVFKDGEVIPASFTFDTGEATLPIQWADVPEDTQSLVLICDDPDAAVGTWGHWALFNLPPSLNELPRKAVDFPEGIGVGKNQLSRREYASVASCEGMNRYFFSLYAIDCKLNLPDGTSKKDILHAMHEHIIDDAQLMGFYERVTKINKEIGC